ncbi:MAG TPA: DsbA family protein [Nitrosopumilaceae archaeon]|nr:DsbA family protein [Nitrosopumilaceae archaeon]
MKKKGIIFSGIISVVIISIIISVTAFESNTESLNLDMSQTHGTVSTAMGSPILGSDSAPITIIEFGDYQCHQCYNWNHNTKDSIVEDYIKTGKANLVFVDLAFLGRDSPKAAAATYCAEEQGKYWEYHDILYDFQEGIDSGWANSERLKAFAQSLDLDEDLFNSCLDSGKFNKRVQFNINEAKKQGASGTPTFIIVNSNGQQEKLVGAQPYTVFKNVLDSML